MLFLLFFMPVWWNGRHSRLKIYRLIRTGSSPVAGTSVEKQMGAKIAAYFMKGDVIMSAIVSKEEMMKAISSIDEELEKLRVIYALFEGRLVSELSDWELEKVEEITTLVYKFIDLRKGLCRLLLKKYGIFII